MSTVTEAAPKEHITANSNPTNSKDFCNAFWGPGNRGPQTLIGRIKLAQATVKEVLQFFEDRSLIEANYAAQLAKLSNSSTLGRNETGILRDTLEALRRETEKQAAHHRHLSSSLFTRCRTRTLIPAFQANYVQLELGLQDQVEKKLKEKGIMEAEVVVAREKYDADCARVFALISQTQSSEEQGQEQARVALCQARDTAEASQTELSHCTERLCKCLSEWEVLWKNFCDRCEDLEEARLHVMKRVLWDNANDFSTAGVGDCD
ncbi:hypothetical protein H0H92_008789, partial [Tricholoma furcatifolium]